MLLILGSSKFSKLKNPVIVAQASDNKLVILKDVPSSPSPPSKPNHPVTVFHIIVAISLILKVVSKKLNQPFTDSQAIVPSAEILKSVPSIPNQPVTVFHIFVAISLILNVSPSPKVNHPFTVSQAVLNNPLIPEAASPSTSAVHVNAAVKASHGSANKSFNACIPNTATIAAAIPAGIASTGAAIAAPIPINPPTNNVPQGISKSINPLNIPLTASVIQAPMPPPSPPNNPATSFSRTVPSDSLSPFFPPKSAVFKSKFWKLETNVCIVFVIFSRPSLNAGDLTKSLRVVASLSNSVVIVFNAPPSINASSNAPLNCLTVSPSCFKPSFLFASIAALRCISAKSSRDISAICAVSPTIPNTDSKPGIDLDSSSTVVLFTLAYSSRS